LLTEADLLFNVKELIGVSKSDLASSYRYVSTEEHETELLNFTAFN